MQTQENWEDFDAMRSDVSTDTLDPQLATDPAADDLDGSPGDGVETEAATDEGTAAQQGHMADALAEPITLADSETVDYPPLEVGAQPPANRAYRRRIALQDIDLSVHRSRLQEGVVLHYYELQGEGVKFPPIEVVWDPRTKKYYLVDGLHRYEATKLAGDETIVCIVTLGDARTALFAFAASNTLHGLSRTNEQKRQAVSIILDDAEWSANSDTSIAKHCGVSTTFVGDMRKEREMGGEAAGAAATTRLTKNGRVMNVANIGKRKSKKLDVADVGADSQTASAEQRPDTAQVEVTESAVAEAPVVEVDLPPAAAEEQRNHRRDPDGHEVVVDDDAPFKTDAGMGLPDAIAEPSAMTEAPASEVSARRPFPFVKDLKAAVAQCCASGLSRKRVHELVDQAVTDWESQA